MSFKQRTHECGVLRSGHAGERIVVNGWAHRVRDLGGLFFVDLRDRSGLVQLFFDPQNFGNLGDIKPETCMSVCGTVRERTEETKNPNLTTGDIELLVESFQILGPCKSLPFPLSDEQVMANVNEELRIKHRYLDLRRPSMFNKLALRAAAVKKIRAYLDDRGFLEVETPIITRSTPEGARDYLVPYRLEPGKFYALPQSPQQYKQLLMVAGIEKYYQIAKCFRDESQRSDRQPEFTQLDLEMSFTTQEDILNLAEGLTREVINSLIVDFGLDKDPVEPFERLTYDESMRLYGCDKPDLRFGLPLFDLTELSKTCGFGVFQSVATSGGSIRGVRYPGGAQLSRKDVGQLEEFCRTLGAKGMASIGVESASEGKLHGGISRFFTEQEALEIIRTSEAEDGDLLCLIADGYMPGNNVLYRLRNEIGERCGLRSKRSLKFCWVVDFPLVEKDHETGLWSPMHHPFTAPKTEDMHLLDSDPAKVHADCYDIVCNGTEWASGSIRIHQSDIQSKVFHLLGIDEKTQQERFGHILEAFTYGAPPHGGIAPGIDRLIMFLTDDENIREVIAFPKMGNGYDPMMDAPSEVDPQQWQELGLKQQKC